MNLDHVRTISWAGGGQGEAGQPGLDELSVEVAGGLLAGLGGGDGGYHRYITGTVRGLGQTGLLYAGGSVPRQTHHGSVGRVETRGAVALSAGHRTGPGTGATVTLGLGH